MLGLQEVDEALEVAPLVRQGEVVAVPRADPDGGVRVLLDLLREPGPAAEDFQQEGAGATIHLPGLVAEPVADLAVGAAPPIEGVSSSLRRTGRRGPEQRRQRVPEVVPHEVAEGLVHLEVRRRRLF